MEAGGGEGDALQRLQEDWEDPQTHSPQALPQCQVKTLRGGERTGGDRTLVSCLLGLGGFIRIL